MIEISFMTGVKLIEPTRAVVRTVISHKGWWIFKRECKEYWIETDMLSLGPYESAGEAAAHMRMINQ